MPVFLPHLPDGSVHHAVGFFGKIGSFQHILQLFLHALILRAEEQQVPLCLQKPFFRPLRQLCAIAALPGNRCSCRFAPPGSLFLPHQLAHLAADGVLLHTR